MATVTTCDICDVKFKPYDSSGNSIHRIKVKGYEVFLWARRRGNDLDMCETCLLELLGSIKVEARGQGEK